MRLSKQPQIEISEDVLEPFYEKKQVCQRLISYLNQLQASAEGDISKEHLASLHEAAAQIVQPHPCHPTGPQYSFESEDSADDFPVGFQQLHMRENDIDPIVKHSAKRRLNGKKSLKKQNMVCLSFVRACKYRETFSL